ncbi:MAG TPA: hypothetical protein VJT31_41855, partial [Rugosimonospora sp.]|nr:hypothetical protein [Rugosimonospora sp.]
LTVAGIVALAGGPLVALGEAAAARWAAPPNYNYTPTIAEWQVALVLALLGLALLAVREILGRAGELHAELETVI